MNKYQMAYNFCCDNFLHSLKLYLKVITLLSSFYFTTLIGNFRDSHYIKNSFPADLI